MVAVEREACRKRGFRGRALRPAAAHGGRHRTAGRMQSGLGRQGSARAVLRGVSVLPRKDLNSTAGLPAGFQKSARLPILSRMIIAEILIAGLALLAGWLIYRRAKR